MPARHAGLLALATLVALGSTSTSAQRPTTPQAAAAPYRYGYHSYDESTTLMRDLVARYPSLASVASIGTTATGKRQIWCMTLTNRATGAPETKPAVYFDGNHHAAEAMGGEVTLHFIHYLLTRYGTDAEITRLLDTRVVYVVQRADPDGAEAFMTGRTDWDVSIVPGAQDLDGDGKKGEDGPDDANGDGEIMRMRVADPDGDWKPYDRDPRLLVRREKGDTKGQFYRVMDEGLDNDGDGKVNEDAPIISFVSNRNYPTFWTNDKGTLRGAGDYPLQEHNARVLVDFIVSKPNISMLESWHTASGIHLRPYAARPDTDFPPQDLHDYSAILSKGTEITTYPVASVYNDFTTIVPGVAADDQPGIRHGVFIDWAYVMQGLFARTTELWTLEPFLDEVGWVDIPRNKPLFAIPGNYLRPDVQAQFLKWLDRHKGEPQLGKERYQDWTPFQHPTLGAVEIGGFSRYILRNPPAGPLFEKVAVDQARFAIVSALSSPLVRIRDVSVTKDGARWTVRVAFANEGWLDTSTEQARIAKLAPPVTATLKPGRGSTLQSAATQSHAFLRGTRGSSQVPMYHAEWTVTGPEGGTVTVTIASEKGGTVTRDITLTTPGTRSPLP